MKTGKFCLSTLLLLTAPLFAGDAIITIAGGGANHGDGPALQANLSFPEGIALDSAGNIFIADTEHHRICKIDTAGTLSVIAGTGVSSFAGDGGPAREAQLASPAGLVVDSAGNIFVADQYSPRIRKIDTAGMISTIAGGGDTPATGTGEAATSANIGRPIAIAFNPAGELLYADGDNNRIMRITAAGTLQLVAGNGSNDFTGDGGPATQAAFRAPFDLAVDAQGNIYVADAGAARVRRIDAATGTINTVAGNDTTEFGGDGGPALEASLDFPVAVALDSAGNLFISDGNHSRIRRVDAVTKVITTLAGNGTRSFYGDGCDPLKASIIIPMGRVFDSAGNLLLADTFNNRIRKIGPGLTSNYDTDCDGIPDHLEALAGSSSTDAGSTPFSGQALGKIEMNLKKIGIQLNFAKASSDKIQFSGGIDVPEGLVVSGQLALVDVGGVSAVFSLDAKGKSTPKGVNSFSTNPKPKNGELKFTVKLDKGNFAATLADENLVNATIKQGFVTVPVALYFNSTVYLELGSLGYNAKLGKSAKAGSGGGVALPGSQSTRNGSLGR